ncbi:I78 family peptidase inhibitor [Brevundimonas sp.]|uniref:I78 family peptidase inhibitor n=1 Tax=Brevundimonas sp. TaxID=1871086 RepID=UPI0025C2D6E8|nr:I78 family peptidase inhibitor [Brevundimonas sp.]
MRILMLSLAAAGLLSACAPTSGTDPATPPMDGPRACKADQYQRLVGTNRSQLPAAPAGETWRVTCTTCPMTMDYNPRRLNITFDQASGVIREVKCG